MEILPYLEPADEDGNVDYTFRVKNNSEEHPKIYETIIKVEPYDDSEYRFLGHTCTCKGYRCKKCLCKHIRYCIEILKQHIPLKYELPTKETS